MAQPLFSYGDAINPKEFTICSLVLKPFSLGHYILLEQFDNPFLTDNANAAVEAESGIYQFILCLWICGNTYEDNLVMFDDNDLLHRNIDAFCQHYLEEMKRDADWNIYAQIFRFREYIAYFTDMPAFQVEHKSTSMPSGIDWKQNLFTIAKSEFGYTDTAILNMPLKRLFYEWCSFAEKNGSIRVQNADEMIMLNALKDRRKQI